MNDFKILSVDTERKTMIVDWGYIVLNHDIPLYILENPDLPKEVMLTHVGYMRPPVPVDYQVPNSLLELVEPTQGLTSEEFIVEGEVLL